MNDALGGVDISEILNSNGSIVSCVLLHAVATKSVSDESSSITTSPSSVLDVAFTSSHPSNTAAEAETAVTTTATTEVAETVTNEEANNNNDSENINKTAEKPQSMKEGDAEEEEKKTLSDNNHSNENKCTTSRGDGDNNKYKLAHLVTQIDVDTTPKKRSVEKILGGPFMFLGQYEDLGVIVMALRPPPMAEEDPTTNENDSNLPPLNPHRLQPPMHNLKVRGDILLMKVSAEEDDDDEDEFEGYDEVDDVKEDNTKVNADDARESEPTKEDETVKNGDGDSSPSEFFLNFTREEYLAFASRTDIVAPEAEEPQHDGALAMMGLAVPGNVYGIGDGEEVALDEIGNEESDEEEDGDFECEEDGEYFELDEEEERVGMMNILMGQILRKFREENGRGPDTKELLQMRQALAMKLGVDVPAISDDDSDGEGGDAKNGDGNENGTKQSGDSPKNGISKTSDNGEDNIKSGKRGHEDDLDSEKPKSKRVRWSISPEENQEAKTES